MESGTAHIVALVESAANGADVEGAHDVAIVSPKLLELSVITCRAVQIADEHRIVSRRDVVPLHRFLRRLLQPSPSDIVAAGHPCAERCYLTGL